MSNDACYIKIFMKVVLTTSMTPYENVLLTECGLAQRQKVKYIWHETALILNCVILLTPYLAPPPPPPPPPPLPHCWWWSHSKLKSTLEAGYKTTAALKSFAFFFVTLLPEKLFDFIIDRFKLKNIGATPVHAHSSEDLNSVQKQRTCRFFVIFSENCTASDCIRIDVTLWDFPSSNHEFDRIDSSGLVQGLVGSTLDHVHQVPTLNSSSQAMPNTTAQSFFNWFRFVSGSNIEHRTTLPFDQRVLSGSEVWVVDQAFFYPMDGLGFGSVVDKGCREIARNRGYVKFAFELSAYPSVSQLFVHFLEYVCPIVFFFF